MNYPVAIHKDKSSDYGVTVPDLPGCFSAGKTLDEAISMAREAIELHLEGLIESGQVVPGPGSVEKHSKQAEYRGAIWATVSVDPANLRLRTKRVNVTIPERVLDAVDRYADEHGETRSGLLVRAVTTLISEQRATKVGPERRPARTQSTRR